MTIFELTWTFLRGFIPVILGFVIHPAVGLVIFAALFVAVIVKPEWVIGE